VSLPDRDQDKGSSGEADDEAVSDNGKPDDKKSEDASKDQAKDKDKNDDKGDDDEQDSGPPLYKRPLFWIIGGIVLIVVVVGSLLWWLHARQFESTDDAFVDTHIVRLAPEVPGILVWVASVDNRHVRPGDLLAIIKPSGPQAQQEQAEADVKQAAAAISQAQAQLQVARANGAKAQADTIAADADAAKAARDLQRYQSLAVIDRAAVANTQIDAARADAESRAGEALAMRRQAHATLGNVRVAQEQVKVARAQYKSQQAKAAQAAVTISDLRLTSSVYGQVVERSVNVGSYVAPGTQLMAIVPDQIWVTANFKETQLTLMRPGQHADIIVDAYPGVHFDGHVDSIERGAGQAFALLPPQNATGNYVKVVQRVPVRILFDKPDPRRWSIGPGMSVSPRVKVR
jgi:membrane fusion protein (multidrug efflux system)